MLVEIPSHWLLVAPCGCVDGSLLGVRRDGRIYRATAEEAWKTFEPVARRRERDKRRGWTVRPIAADDDLVKLLTTPCPHQKKDPDA